MVHDRFSGNNCYFSMIYLCILSPPTIFDFLFYEDSSPAVDCGTQKATPPRPPPPSNYSYVLGLCSNEARNIVDPVRCAALVVRARGCRTPPPCFWVLPRLSTTVEQCLLPEMGAQRAHGMYSSVWRSSDKKGHG